MIFLWIFLSATVAWLTYRWVKVPGISPSRASTSLSLLIFLIIFGLNKLIQVDVHFYSALVFGASFIGMSSHKIISDWEVLTGGLFFALGYIFLVEIFSGLGGVLGLFALTSLSTSRLIIFLLKKYASPFLRLFSR